MIMNVKDEQVSRSYIDLLSRWQLMNDYVKIYQLVPSLRTVWFCDKLRQFSCASSAACRQQLDHGGRMSGCE